VLAAELISGHAHGGGQRNSPILRSSHCHR
jgi:hypothetical protein